MLVVCWRQSGDRLLPQLFYDRIRVVGREFLQYRTNRHLSDVT